MLHGQITNPYKLAVQGQGVNGQNIPACIQMIAFTPYALLNMGKLCGGIEYLDLYSNVAITPYWMPTEENHEMHKNILFPIENVVIAPYALLNPP